MHAGQLFSEHFLVEGIRTTDAYRQLAEDRVFLRDLLSRLQEAFDRFLVQAFPDEAQTEQDLIFRILEALGWNRDLWQVQPRAARKGRSDVPDMLLFPDSDAKANALAESQDKRFRYGVAIVENKRWDRPLARATKGTRKGDVEREVPSSQVLRYLSRAETLSERRIQWGILSNGRLWRLYYQGANSRLEQYLEIDLSRLVDAPSLADLLTERVEAMREHWLRVFALMFRRISFVEQGADGRTFHLLALDEGRNWEARVARDLSNLVFIRIFPNLVRALDAADPYRPHPAATPIFAS
jgi:hypothetical protein